MILGDMENATTHANQAIRIDPKNPIAKKLLIELTDKKNKEFH